MNENFTTNSLGCDKTSDFNHPFNQQYNVVHSFFVCLGAETVVPRSTLTLPDIDTSHLMNETSCAGI